MNHYQRSQRNAFTADFPNRAAVYQRDELWIAQQLHASTARFLPVWGAQTLIAGDATLHPALLTAQEAAPLLECAEALIFLGEADGLAYFALAAPESAPDFPALVAPYGRFQELRSIAALLSHAEGSLLAYARAIVTWHLRNRFCGICGGVTRSERGGHQRRCVNPACNAQHFPRTDPAIIVLVTRGSRCLLAVWTPGRYSTIAGFVEPGESLEQAVAREVLEETGIRLASVTYHSSQPWPFPASIMLGFTARAATSRIRLNDGELEAARWFTRAELEAGLHAGMLSLPSPFSIAHRLITDWFEAVRRME